jgi:hypothetical protein
MFPPRWKRDQTIETGHRLILSLHDSTYLHHDHAIIETIQIAIIGTRWRSSFRRRLRCFAQHRTAALYGVTRC